MKRFVLPILLFLFFLNLSAQEELPSCKCNSVDMLVSWAMSSTIQEAHSFLGAGSDPFGIHLGLKVRVQKAGQAVAEPYTAYNPAELNAMAAGLAGEQKFDEYNFDIPGQGRMLGDGWSYSVGLVPTGPIKEDSREFQVIAKNYSCNQSIDGVISKVIIESYVIVTGKKPVDGAIQADVYAYDKNGQPQQWRSSTWGPSGRIAYTRVYPGNETTNSKQGKDNWKQVSANVAMDAQYNPGYYVPKIDHRGCVQDFSIDPERFKDLMATLKLTQIPQWDDFIMANGKAIAKNTLEVETQKAPNFQTFFSLGNTVYGKVFDPEGKPVKKGVKVHIEPKGWTIEKQVEPVETDDAGNYKFDRNIETGVYKVFTEDNPDGAEEVKVCNDPETENYNYSYQQDINDQTDLTFLIECTETYTEDIEPLRLEGAVSLPGKVARKTVGYSVINIQSKVINDFFEETYINNVIGAPVDDKSKVISFSSEKYSFEPADTETDGWIKSVKTTADYDGSPSMSYIFPARKLDGKMQDTDLFLVDSIATNSNLEKKLQNKKWEMLLGPAYIEGRGLDKEIITHREARPVSLAELKRCKESKSSIRLTQEVEYKQGYNTNFLGLGKFMEGKDLEGMEVMNKLMEDPDLLNQAIGGVDNMAKINPEMAKYMKENPGQKNMATFMRSAFGTDKYSGMFESWASKVKMKREITLKPISGTEASKYLTSGQAFEVTGVKTENNVDPDQVKDLLKGLFENTKTPK